MTAEVWYTENISLINITAGSKYISIGNAYGSGLICKCKVLREV